MSKFGLHRMYHLIVNCERSKLSGLFNGTDFRYNCERSELSSLFNGTDFSIYIFQAVRRAVNVLNVSTCI